MATPTLWKYTLREVQRRPGRALLTLLGIVIGVANVFAVSATVHATRQAYRSMFDAVGGKADLEIVTGQRGFDQGLARTLDLSGVEGVDATVNLIQTPTGLRTPSGPVPVLVLGVEPGVDERARSYQVGEGRPLESNERGLLLGRAFARSLGLEVGSTVELQTPRSLFASVERLPVVGLLEAAGPGLYNGGAVAVMPLPLAQDLFLMSGKITSVQLVLKPGADPERVRAELQRRLEANPQGRDLEVQTPASRSDIARYGLATTEQAFGTLSVVGLVGGAFVILNSFLMNLTERRRQLAILRAVGTTRGQVTRLLLREAILLGIVGTALGIGAGVLLAQGLIHIHELFLGVKLPPLRPTWVPFVLAVALGPGMALAATWFPAHQAGRRSPLEALLPRGRNPDDPVRHWPRWLGLAAVLLSIAFVVGLATERVSSKVGNDLLPAMMVLVLVGCVLVLPAFLDPLMPRLAGLLRRPLGIEGAIAARQLQRQPVRTSLTVGVLFIGIIVTVGFGNSLLNNIDDIDVWYRKSIPADYLVRGYMPDPASVQASNLPPDLPERIRGLEGVDRVGKVTFVQTRTEGDLPCLVIARSVAPDRPLPLALVEGDEDEVRRAMLRGEVAVGSVLAQRLGKHPGDTLRLRNREVRIAGIIKEYTVGGLVLYWDWDHADAALGMPGVHVYEVHATPERRDAVGQELRALAARHGLTIQTNRDLWATIDAVIQAVDGFLWVLIALVFVVASLGIVNTLTMNVHEQTRELGLLRAVGMKRGQVARLVLAQGLLMGLLSVLLGGLVGILVAYLMHVSTYSLTGHVVAFQLHWRFLAVCCLAALLISVLAAIIPAGRAGRLEILDALRYE